MTEDLQVPFGRNPSTGLGDDPGGPGRASAQRPRNRRLPGAVVATVAGALALGVGLTSQRLLSAPPDPAAAVPEAPQPTATALGSLGRLAYVHNGDVFVADADGRNPVRIADGAPGKAGSCTGYWAEGPMWSPDGRYLAFRRDGGEGPAGGCDRTANITDAAGKRLASFPAEGWAISWSPDSTRVAAWVDFYPGTKIGIYGIDGVRHALVTVPPMHAGDFDPVWSPDGASLLLPFGVEVRLDGSPPRKPPADDPRSQWMATYSPDRAHVAYITRSETTTSGELVPATLSVVGTDGFPPARVLVPIGVESAGGSPVWSPTGDRIAFASSVASGRQADPYSTELGIADVAFGAVTSLVRGGSNTLLTAIEFSPDGGQILYSRWDASNVGLWSIQVDGSDPHLLVPGTAQGDWQSSSPAR